MAYRRKQGTARATTFEDFRSSAAAEESSSSPSSLAAQAIRASAAHRDSSLSSAYGESAYRHHTSPPSREPTAYEYTSLKSLNESKYGFWGVLARKAKAILEDDNAAQQSDHTRIRPHMLDTSTDGQYYQPYRSPESYRKTENPAFHKGSEAIASSFNYIGGTIRNALEEGLKNVENKTADIIQETRKLQIRRKGAGSSAQNQTTDPPQIQNDLETQLKASRDVANAMAAKAKLLLRELKTVKADLAFAKERCRQLEEENKILRESRDKGDHAEDDDLIRLQLETLLAEKARLAHENSIYARENRFLREIVEYHQLTMQDVVYVDEGIEEVTEVYPFPLPSPSSHAVLEAPSAAASPAPSPTPSRASPPPPLNPMVVPEACPIVPTPPTPPPQIATGSVPAETKSDPSSPVDTLKRQDSATQSA